MARVHVFLSLGHNLYIYTLMICKFCGGHTSKPVPAFPWHCDCGTVWHTLANHDRPGEPCKHLGDPTGETIECSSCGGGGGTVKVLACAVHVKATLRKTKPKTGPPWAGMNCVECRARGLDKNGHRDEGTTDGRNKLG